MVQEKIRTPICSFLLDSNTMFLVSVIHIWRKYMLISILVPVYNVAKYLPQCLESIENQKFKDYEIILVDDGSTDGSETICDSFQANHPSNTRVIHQENQGLLGARITAIKAANGKYCLCLDSDDYWDDNCLTELSELSYATNADVIVFECKLLIDETRSVKTKQPNFNSDKEFIDDKRLLYELLICGSSFNSIWRKLVLTQLMKEAVNEYDNLPLNMAGEDLVQSLYPITHASRVYYSTKQLYVYRIRPTSLGTNVDFNNIFERSMLTARHFLLKYMDKWKLNDAYWLERYHCVNMISLADSIFGLLSRDDNPLKTAEKLKRIDLNNLIDSDAYKYRHSKFMDFKSRTKVNLVLNKSVTMIGLIAQFLKALRKHS